MGGVMRPVGPEPAETYWMRRALVVGGVLVLVIAVLIFLFNLGGSPGAAAPNPNRPTALAGASVTPSPSPTQATSPSTSPTPSPTPTASDAGRPSPSPSHGPSANTDRKKTSAKPSASESKSASPSATPVAACTSGQLRPVLQSTKHNVSIGAKVLFGVSYINRSDRACSLTVNPDTYQLKIYSGTDRIWSTADCTKLVRKSSTVVKPDGAAVWTVAWNGRRSMQGKTCQNRPETPRAGYYHAISDLHGARPVDYVLILK